MRDRKMRRAEHEGAIESFHTKHKRMHAQADWTDESDSWTGEVTLHSRADVAVTWQREQTRRSAD